jgi:signal transduction histidine kinase/ligand-binding sensor domain-containing protein
MRQSPHVLARSPAAVVVAVAMALGARPGFSHDSRGSGPTGLGDYRVDHWTTAHGLPQNTITDIAFLPKGELWLSTFGGLVRFDGHRFQTLDMASDEELPANRIVSLAATGTESFLFLTQQGHLGRVDAGRVTPLLSPPEASVEALELLVNPDGSIYCKSATGRAWRTDGSHAWQPVEPRDTGDGPLRDFALDEHGATWAVRGDRLRPMEGPSSASAKLPRARDVILSSRPGGGLWVALRQVVARFDGVELDPLRVQPVLERKIDAIEPAGEDGLFVATSGDVSRLDRQADGSWRRTSLPLHLPPALSIRALRLDSAGSLWIGTAGGGLLRVNRLPTRRFGAASGLADVAGLAPDGEGGAFVASGCNGLFHLDRSGVAQAVRLPPPGPIGALPPCGISLSPGPGDVVWARSGRNLLDMRRPSLAAQTLTSALPFDEGPVVATGDGSLWVASRNGTVQRVSPGGALVRELQLPAPLMSASSGPDGTLWIGGDGEVFHIGRDGIDRFGPAEHVPRGLVRDVLAESDGTVWIGTYGGGVGRLRAGRAARLTAREGLPDNSVSRILDDGRGRLWISTNRGIAVVDKRALNAVAEGRARTLGAVVLGAERGVPEANFGSPAGFADPDGRLWFGTIDGVVSIDSAAFPFNTTPPAVRIESLLADDRPLPLAETVTVPPLTARLRVGFGAFELLYPERLRFRFRVEGLDGDWVDAGPERSVDWSPPGPGRHRFLVEARNEDGVWSAAPAVVVLDVRPAWWQATTFRVALALGLVALGAGAVRLRFREVERRHAERLGALEEQRRAEAHVNSLRAQLEHVSRAALAGELAASLAHEVRQPIGAIVNNAEAGRRQLAHYLQRPGDMQQIFEDIVADGLRASEVLEGLRGFLQVSGPGAETIDLSALVSEMLPLVRRELQDNHVTVDLELAAALPPVEGLRVQLGQVLVNLVVNACETLAGKDGERRVTVSTAARADRVELAVRDNGPGLDPSVAERVFEPFVSTKPGGLGVGLAVCRSIAERHGGRLFADAPPDGGLRMTLALPVAREPASRP